MPQDLAGGILLSQIHGPPSAATVLHPVDCKRWLEMKTLYDIVTDGMLESSNLDSWQGPLRWGPPI